MACRDVMQFHEVCNFWVRFDLSCNLRSLSPGVVCRGSSLSSFSGVPSVFGRVTSLLMPNEAFSVPNMLCFFIWGKVDLVYVHSVRIQSGGSVSRQDVAISSSLELSELYHVSVEFPHLVKPLFPFPTSLSIGEGSSSHHDSKLLGYSSLEGVY